MTLILRKINSLDNFKSWHTLCLVNKCVCRSLEERIFSLLHQMSLEKPGWKHPGFLHLTLRELIDAHLADRFTSNSRCDVRSYASLASRLTHHNLSITKLTLSFLFWLGFAAVARLRRRSTSFRSLVD